MSTEDRQAAQRRLNELIAMLKGLPHKEQLGRLIEEGEALDRAIKKFTGSGSGSGLTPVSIESALRHSSHTRFQ